MTQSNQSAATPIRPLAVTLGDATKYSTLSRSALYKAMADGRLEARKVGKRTLIIYDSLEALIKGGDQYQSEAA